VRGLLLGDHFDGVDTHADRCLLIQVNFNGVDYTVNVKKRPHMEYFLKQVSKRFEVVVFTASHRAYAEKLLNLIDPHRELIKYENADARSTSR
jgi:CTD small phosphatase-like protein 2